MIRLLFFTLLLPSLSFAADWKEDAKAALHEKNRQEFERIIETAAAYDDEAKFAHAENLAIAGRFDDAISVYEVLAKKGYTKPALEMAMIYIYSKGDPDSKQIGANLMHVATQFSIEAQAEMATLYQYGIGVEKNDMLACSWFKTADKNGFPNLQKNINEVCD